MTVCVKEGRTKTTRRGWLRLAGTGVALNLLPTGLLSPLAGAFAVGCGPGPVPPSAPSPKLGQSLPKFRRDTMDGRKVEVGRPGTGVTVVKFFAKYCKPCKKTLPEAQALSEAYPDVAFVGVAEDEYRKDVDEMIATYRLTFPVVHDRGNVLAGRFRVTQLPATFVADDTGTIRWVSIESTHGGGLEAAIDWVRAGAPSQG
ncbi:MAG: TlpA disulfide reductase family protein [Myxococcota bacterium]